MVATGRALAAAQAAARGRGLPVADARVIRDSTNVLVHLAPAPIVARVPLTFTRLRDSAWAAQHVRLAAYLANRGAPVAPPTVDVDPGPHAHDGLLVSFWTLVAHDPARANPVAAGRSLRDLHAAMAGWSEPLATCDRLEEVGRLLDTLQPSNIASADDLAGLRQLRTRLSALPGRPIHGDAHLRNVLWSPDGPLWGDLENACAGPVEWDLACIAWRRAAGAPAALEAYGAYDEARVAEVMPALTLFLATWTIVAAERAPTPGALAEARRRVALALSLAESDSV